MVPNGWKLTSLGEVCSGKLQTGPFGSQLHAHEYTDEGVPVLMPKDLINYRANNKSAAKIPEHRADDLKKHTLQSGDLLFSRRGDVARFALIESDYPRSLCGTGCLKATPNKAHSPFFLSYFLQKDAVKKWLEQNAVGQTMPNMNTAILAELPLMVASSRLEEDKIAKILSTWDKAIASTEKLVEISKQQKKALMQQLLTGKKRLVNPEKGKAFEGAWKNVYLKKLISEVKKTKEAEPNNVELLTVKLHHKGVKASGKYPNATKGGRPYYKRNKGELIIGRQNLHNGGIAIVTEECDGLIASNAISSFEVTSSANVQFILNKMSTAHFIYTIDNLTGGTGQKEISVKELLKIKISIPSIKEQQKIALVLTTADKEIEVLEAKLALFKQEKKALMQQLLTGKRRVKIAETEAA
ncbi:restriction endonuclease subunit S [Vibrio splendidus]|uniref:Restriction endonuclease subunit S n=1 Tax=Vibrio splendidus TaxID=29497 RepID=A0ABD5AA24_VIBSP|nr:restriction endonuclease subunit S [Vibrio splendidus]MDP2489959.1 restriction endonuclease subunit S [Vibrio splendidus]